MNIQAAIQRLIDSGNLSADEMTEVMTQIMSGEATPAQIAGFLVALRVKGETVEEISAAAVVMRDKATGIACAADTIVDTCGTGGDASGTINISTCAAFVVAACGLTVAKHGNRAVSSASGSADVLKSLGVNIEASQANVERSLAEIGIGFLFAPLLHSAMKHAIGPRRELGIRTIFNMLGPLTNPAKANVQVIGVYDKELVRPIAEVLMRLGSRGAYVVHGSDGLDEITLTGHTYAAFLQKGEIAEIEIVPSHFGLENCTIKDIRGGTAEDNAATITAILSGAESGPKRDIVCLNAAAAIHAAGKSLGLSDGIELANHVIDSGKALEKLQRLVEVSNAG